MLREVLKVSGAIPIHLMVGIGVALAVTGSWQMAGAIAIIEPIVAAVVLWGYEKLWHHPLAHAHSPHRMPPVAATWQDICGSTLPTTAPAAKC